jgi:hypothetical protein
MENNFKVNISWLINAYGHLIPWNRIVTGIEFADLIKEAYSLEDRHNKMAFEFARNSNCRFTSNYEGMGYCLIK